MGSQSNAVYDMCILRIHNEQGGRVAVMCDTHTLPIPSRLCPESPTHLGKEEEEEKEER